MSSLQTLFMLYDVSFQISAGGKAVAFTTVRVNKTPNQSPEFLADVSPMEALAAIEINCRQLLSYLGH